MTLTAINTRIKIIATTGSFEKKDNKTEKENEQIRLMINFNIIHLL